MKQSKREGRKIDVLLGLVELYLEEGKPIGSNTLRERGFESISSATIRNYFAELEQMGLLAQQHASGGRIPTQGAFRLYAERAQQSTTLPDSIQEGLKRIELLNTTSIATFLHQATEELARLTGFATFLSSVRFDHDLIQTVRLVSVDETRVLCVLLTDFGQILTEVLSTEERISSFSLKRIESYFSWRLQGKKGSGPTQPLDAHEERLALEFYNEILVRYIVRYSNFSDEEIYRTGFSHLLAYPEFNDPVVLASSLSLFENSTHMRLLLNDCARAGELSFWIGQDLTAYASGSVAASVLAIPFHIGQVTAGAVGLLGPCRMPYKTLFATLRAFSKLLSHHLSGSVSRQQLTFRHPRSHTPYIGQEERQMIDHQTLSNPKEG